MAKIVKNQAYLEYVYEKMLPDFKLVSYKITPNITLSLNDSSLLSKKKYKDTKMTVVLLDYGDKVEVKAYRYKCLIERHYIIKVL